MTTHLISRTSELQLAGSKLFATLALLDQTRQVLGNSTVNMSKEIVLIGGAGGDSEIIRSDYIMMSRGMVVGGRASGITLVKQQGTIFILDLRNNCVT